MMLNVIQLMGNNLFKKSKNNLKNNKKEFSL